jgi:hypothetical protein
MSVSTPDVPDAPGVPVVDRQTEVTESPLPPLTADDPAVVSAFADARWGVYLNGENAFPGATSVLSVEFKKGYKVANHPIEEGSFASYNKVEEPFEARISLSCDGTVPAGDPSTYAANRESFLAAVMAACGDLKFYSVCVPEFTYINANLGSYQFSRKVQNGITLFVVEIAVQEVRVASGVTFTSTADPSAVDQVNSGPPQTQVPTAGQTPPTQAPSPNTQNPTVTPAISTGKMSI